MKNTAKLIAAAAIGVVAGGVLGLLFAPEKGDETRKKIAKQSDKMLQKVKVGYSKEKITKIKEKLEAKLNKVNAKLEEISREETKPA